MLINLADIKLDSLKVNPQITNLLEKYAITNYAELKLAIQGGNLELRNNLFICTALNDALSLLSSQKDHEIPLTKTNNTREAIALVNNLDYTIKAADLPLFVTNPTLIYTVFYHQIGHSCDLKKRKKIMEDYKDVLLKSMAALKQRVASQVTDMHGQKVPLITAYGSGIGPEKYSRLVSSINFYDNYTDYLIKSYGKVENPFYYQQDTKRTIVKENEKDIFYYLFNEGYEFIWGPISDTARIKIIDTLNNKNNQLYQDKIDAIENVITNFITVNESCDVTNPQVLNKFIVPFGRQ